MKTIFYIFFCSLAAMAAKAQTSQISIGSAGTNEFFNDVKFDATGGGVVKVGVKNSNNGNGNDCYIVKLDANRQIAWQKVLSNAGDDAYYRVVVCANGDYLAIGQTFAIGARRGIVHRINAATGAIIWTRISANTPGGELFWDGLELPNHNIVLVGADNYQVGGSNGFIIQMTQDGGQIRSGISNWPTADEFRTVNLLPNGNLLVGGFYNTGGNYAAVMLEIDPNDRNIILSQNSYNIGMSLPGGVGFVNSIWVNQGYVKDNTVIFSMYLFQGYGTAANQAVCVYDQTTKALTGKVYYHNGNNNAYAYSIYPVTANDLLVTQSFTGPSAVYISRINNGNTVFNKKINNAVKYISNTAVNTSGQAVFSGAYSGAAGTDDGYDLFSNTDITPGTTDCAINDISNLAAIPISLPANQSNAITFNAFGVVAQPVSVTEIQTTDAAATICSSILPGTGTGLQGTYYRGMYLSGSPLLNRIDPSIDFEFTYSKQPVVLSPAPGVVPEDEYSVRWTGQVQPMYSENYTFSVLSDDGVRLWVNGVQLIDNWTNQSATEKSGSIQLQAGQKYDIKLEYYEHAGEAVTKLYWSGNSTAKQIIPSSQLYPSGVPPVTGGGNGLLGTYYNGINLAGAPLLSRIDPTVNMELTYSKQPVILSPAPGIVPEDMFSVRWSGKVMPLYSETYTFYAATDDGVRLWVNGVKLIDNWVNQGTTEAAASISLSAGQQYDIVLEYYENTGEAVAKLLWSGASTPKSIIPQAQLYPGEIPAAGSGTGTGLRGYYYPGIYLGNAVNGENTGATPLLTRIDTTVDFELTYSKQPVVLSPAPGIVPEDMFSVSWAGQVEAPLSETFTFYTACDDGVRLFVGDRALIENWQNQGVTETSNTIDMIAGRKYNIYMQYYEYTGEAVAKLYWSSPSIPKQIVPKSRLYPAALSNARTMDNSTALRVTPLTANENTAPVFGAVLQPNPVKTGQAARLQVTSNKTGKVIVTVLGSNGNRVSNRSFNLVKGVNSTNISTSGLTQGLYFVNITGGDKPITVKLVVE